MNKPLHSCRISTQVEVRQITPKGVLLWVNKKEYLLTYSKYPCFKNVSICDILTVSPTENDTLHWEALQVEIELSSIIPPAKRQQTRKTKQ